LESEAFTQIVRGTALIFPTSLTPLATRVRSLVFLPCLLSGEEFGQGQLEKARQEKGQQIWWCLPTRR
jgi:hypothetical protein